MSIKTTREILADLVSFDTTSTKSNLPLIDYVRDYLARLGVSAEIFLNESGEKANLWATIGPAGPGGFILSGHTDCVPVEGQAWSSDPFALTERGDLLYGRGASDMKGFLSSALACVPNLVSAGLKQPVHLAFSYDEEIGCTGVREMINRLARRGEKPAACLVGEPTSMGVIVGHKGGQAYRFRFTGSEAHSSLAPRAVNAVEFAAEFVVFIRSIARDLAIGPTDADYDIAHSTISTGSIHGGAPSTSFRKTVLSPLSFVTSQRSIPNSILARISAFIANELLPAMRSREPEAVVAVEPIYDYPAFNIDPSHSLVTRIKSVVGHNRHSKVAFGTEAGLFQRDLGVPTVVCGPGSIDVAHKPDEFVSQDQLDRCDLALRRLLL